MNDIEFLIKNKLFNFLSQYNQIFSNVVKLVAIAYSKTY